MSTQEDSEPIASHRPTHMRKDAVLEQDRRAFMNGLDATCNVIQDLQKHVGPDYAAAAAYLPREWTPTPWQDLVEARQEHPEFETLIETIEAWLRKFHIDGSVWSVRSDWIYDSALQTLELLHSGGLGVSWLDPWYLIELMQDLDEAATHAERQNIASTAEPVLAGGQLENLRALSDYKRALGEPSLGSPQHLEDLRARGIPVDPPRDSITLTFNRWQPRNMGWTEFAKQLRPEFSTALAQYRSEREKDLAQYGVEQVHVKNNPRHFIWLAKYHSLRKPLKDVLEPGEDLDDSTLLELDKDLDDSTVLRGIKATAKRIGLKLRPGTRGPEERQNE